MLKYIILVYLEIQFTYMEFIFTIFLALLPLGKKN